MAFTMKNMAYWKAKNGNPPMKQATSSTHPDWRSTDKYGNEHMFDEKGRIVETPESKKKRRNEEFKKRNKERNEERNEEYMQSIIEEQATPEKRPRRDPRRSPEENPPMKQTEGRKEKPKRKKPSIPSSPPSPPSSSSPDAREEKLQRPAQQGVGRGTTSKRSSAPGSQIRERKKDHQSEAFQNLLGN